MRLRYLFLFTILFVISANATVKDIIPKPKLCIPCTPYCKTHPNSERCT